MELYIIISLLVAVIILLIFLLVKQSKSAKSPDENLDKKLNDFSVTMNDEFERSRRENAVSQKEMRAEVSDSLDEMRSKLEQFRVDYSDRQSRLERAFLKSMSENRITNMEQNEKQNKILSDAVEKLRESNEKKLDEMRNTVDEKLTSTLSTRLDSSFKTVSDRLENVYKSLGEMKELSSGVTENVSALNRVLTNVKARGTWAEVQLGQILDQTIPGRYETNFQCVPSSSERVEFAVRIPSADGMVTYLPIDSKFPMEDYVRLCNAADAGDPDKLELARKNLEIRVVAEAKDITKYINVPLTTPYAIMYLATEGLYSEIVSSRSGIAEKIQSEFGIMIAGPSTITALLNSLALGFRAVAINEKANEVRLLLAAAKHQYEKFGDLIGKARRKIDEAGNSLDEAGKRNEIIAKKLKGIEELDDSQSDYILDLKKSDEAEEN